MIAISPLETVTTSQFLAFVVLNASKETLASTSSSSSSGVPTIYTFSSTKFTRTFGPIKSDKATLIGSSLTSSSPADLVF